jgi:hypothetical protein
MVRARTSAVQVARSMGVVPAARAVQPAPGVGEARAIPEQTDAAARFGHWFGRIVMTPNEAPIQRKCDHCADPGCDRGEKCGHIGDGTGSAQHGSAAVVPTPMDVDDTASGQQSGVPQAPQPQPGAIPGLGRDNWAGIASRVQAARAANRGEDLGPRPASVTPERHRALGQVLGAF